MKVLHVSPTFYPATFWGGPIYSTKAICDATQAMGAEVSVLSTDAAGPRLSQRLVRDAKATQNYPIRYSRRLAGVSIAPGLMSALPGAIRQADLVHLTGTFSFPTLPTLALARRLGRPVVWSLRGAVQAMVDWRDVPGRMRKTAFLAAAKHLLSDRVLLHATADSEAAANAQLLPDCANVVIANAVPLPPNLSPRRDSNKLRLIFVSRLHPKKGLDLLLDAMAALPPHVTLDIYGTGEAAHVAEITTRAAPLGDRVHLYGHLEDAAKPAAFAASDIFVLPSYSENFGIVVAEAMAHGLPVITTHGTPWEVVETQGCGRWIPASRQALMRAIRALEAADRAAMGARGRALVKARYAAPAMGQRFLDTYAHLIATTGGVAS